MKKKELKKLAEKIWALETIVETNDDPQKVKKAKEKILRISGGINPDDMIAIDEIIQSELR